MPHLLDLPDELLSAIVAACAEERDSRHRLSSQSPGRETILNFAKSCRRAFSLAEPCLYDTITLRKGVTNSDFLKSLQQRLYHQADRKRFIKDIALVPSSGDADPDLLEWALLVVGLPKLEHIHIEVPFAQSDAVDDEETGEYMSPFWTSFRKSFELCIIGTRIPAWASSLRTCHLNFSAPNGYCVQLRNVANVFAAPQIRRVSLVAADLSNFELDRKSIRPRTSPLQHIYLENCIVSGEALRHILSIPKGLVSFAEYGGLTPNESTTHHDRLYSLIQALVQHKSTFTHLSVNPRDLRTLSDFESSTSKTVSFVPLSHLSHLTIDFRDWRFDPGPTSFLERLPHRLKHLHLRVDLSQYAMHTSSDFEYWANYFAYWTNRIRRRTNRYRPHSSTFPRLKTFAAEMMHVTPRVIKQSHRDILETAAWRLKKESKVRMLLYRRTKQRNAIPPYLWDEYEPELVTMLDSDSMEKTSLWDVETPSEIEDTKRQEKEWEINRMIELDQLELELQRQRLIIQFAQWEKEDMPAQEDLDAASAALKKEKDRQAREALEVPGGLPIIPWDCPHASTEVSSDPPSGGNSSLAGASISNQPLEEGGGGEASHETVDDVKSSSTVLVVADYESLPSSGPLPDAAAQSGVSSGQPPADKPHAEHAEQANEAIPPVDSAKTVGSSQTTNGAANDEQASADGTSQTALPLSNSAIESSPAPSPTEGDEPAITIQTSDPKAAAHVAAPVPDTETEQKQRESKDKGYAGKETHAPAVEGEGPEGGDGDAASVDAEEAANSAEPGSSRSASDAPTGDGAGGTVTVTAAAGSPAGKVIHGSVQAVAVG